MRNLLLRLLQTSTLQLTTLLTQRQPTRLVLQLPKQKPRVPIPPGRRLRRKLPSQLRRTRRPNKLKVKNLFLAYVCTCTESCECDHMLTVASTSPEPSKTTAEKPTDDGDVEMKDAPDATTSPPAEDKTEQGDAGAPNAGGDDANAAAPNASKTKTPARRKSTAGADSAKGKKLNKKASRAAITHIDAQPGQHFFIKLKGYPQWPCIICDEDMLPHALIKTRPVSAARSDGTYREDFADGGKRAADRTFPIMYLATNEL